MRDAIRPGLLAVQKFWKPFLVIQVAGLAVLVGYYRWPPLTQAADALADAKTAGGLLAAAVASVVSGALLPELAKIITFGDFSFPAKRRSDVAFHAGLFAVVGVLADTFYNFVNWLFADLEFLPAVAAKVTLDQTIYSPMVVLPLIALLFHLRESGWRAGPVAGQLSPAWYRQRVLPLLVMSWAFWIPMCLVMYSLPGKLTFAFAMFAQAAWSILMTFIAAQPGTPHAAEAIVNPPMS